MPQLQKIKNVEQLLSQVNTMVSSFQRISEAEGDNFNIFSVLKIETNEVTTHSRFIAELLNPSGVHGYKDAFLKLFIEGLDIKNNLDTSKCTVTVEAYQGKVTEERGGSIDILIKENNSNHNVIMIENKIYAGEQPNQLLRYHNAYPQGELIFLTLYGDPSTEPSSKSISYEQKSYQSDIISWLENCRKISVTSPPLRETLSQYINLVKKITNQNTNQVMSKEITNKILETESNFDAMTSIYFASIELSKSIIEATVKPILLKVIEGKGLTLDLNLEENGYPSFGYSNDKMKGLGLQILFSSSSITSIDNVVFGIQPLSEEGRNVELESKIVLAFQNEFNQTKPGYLNWVCSIYFDNYRNWNDFETLKKIHFKPEDFENELRDIIDKLLVILEKV